MITINQIKITILIINNNKNIPQKHNNKKHQHHNQNFSYNVNSKYEPQIPIVGKTTTLEIHITEQKSGNIIQDFETIHVKLMHLIAFRSRPFLLAHIHPLK